MARKSWTVPISFIILLGILGYSAFVLMQDQAGIVFIIPALWGILLPLISDFPYSATYLFSIPAPFLGTLFVLMLLVGKYFGLSIPLFILLILLSSAIISVFHVATRWRTKIWKLSMAYASRAAIAVSSIIFLTARAQILATVMLMVST